MTEVPGEALIAARAQFQDCRLALYLVGLLTAIEVRRREGGEVDDLVSAVEQANGFDSPVPLRNQATFLQMAYMTLVFPHQGVVDKAIGKWEPRLDWSRVQILKDTWEPPRFVKTPNWNQLLRTVRNSLAHSTIEVEETRFIFTDDYRGNIVEVCFDWSFLGELTMEFFAAANKALYPALGDPGAQGGPVPS